MKKIVSILLVFSLCLIAFTGCSTESASRIDRWKDESVSFSVSLLQDALRNENGDIVKDADGNTVRPAEDGFFPAPTMPGAQVRPDAISADSSFNYEIKTVDGNWQLEQTLRVKETFLKANHSFLNNDDWKSVVKSPIYTIDADGNVTFESEMTSTVVFKTFKSGGAAVRSTKAVKSVFVFVADEDGNHSITYNDFQVAATYEGKNAKTTFTDNNPDSLWSVNSGDVKISSGVFDNEMLIFAVRSLDLPKVAELSGATFSSYNALDQKTQTVSVLAGILDENAAEKEYVVKAAPSNQPMYPYLLYFETQNYTRVSISGSVPSYDLIKFSQNYMKFSRV